MKKYSIIYNENQKIEVVSDSTIHAAQVVKSVIKGKVKINTILLILNTR